MWVVQLNFVQFMNIIERHEVHILRARKLDLTTSFTRIRVNNITGVNAMTDDLTNFGFTRTVKSNIEFAQNFGNHWVWITLDRVERFYTGKKLHPLLILFNNLVDIYDVERTIVVVIFQKLTNNIYRVCATFFEDTNIAFLNKTDKFWKVLHM
jgi:hypothetical protein